ncbi:hypothetical protein ACPTKN_14330 [Enterococcus faecalis]|uniref:hypothetical protein n=1 Tax=Enterococcus faecalis TaxID=1351 RepID=UPI003CC66FE8
MKGIGKLILFCSLGTGALMVGSSNAFADISVKNIDPYSSFDASVNTYGDGQSSYYTIAPKKTETWSRSDSKGFLLAIDTDFKNHRNPKMYYASSNAGFYRQDDILKSGDGKARKIINADENRFVKNNKGEYIYSDVKISGSSNKVIVKNIGSSTKVAISTWSGGDSSFYNLSKGETENWSRSHDPRGYLMIVKDAKYFIHSGEAAIINGYSVYINNKLAQRCDLEG